MGNLTAAAGVGQLFGMGAACGGESRARLAQRLAADGALRKGFERGKSNVQT